MIMNREVIRQQQLESKVKPYYFTQVVANRVMEMTDFLAQIPEIAYRDNTQSYTDENGIEQINYRSCEIFIPDQSSVFYHAVKNVINDVNNESYQYDLSDKYDIQILKYRPGGHYEWHIDYGICWHPGLDRKLSISIQLSNESQYEGGELEIRNWKGDNVTAPKRLGSAIVFDSRVTHRAKPVTEGERIVLVGWASGPKLR